MIYINLVIWMGSVASEQYFYYANTYIKRMTLIFVEQKHGWIYIQIVRHLSFPFMM